MSMSEDSSPSHTSQELESSALPSAALATAGPSTSESQDRPSASTTSERFTQAKTLLPSQKVNLTLSFYQQPVGWLRLEYQELIPGDRITLDVSLDSDGYLSARTTTTSQTDPTQDKI